MPARSVLSHGRVSVDPRGSHTRLTAPLALTACASCYCWSLCCNRNCEQPGMPYLDVIHRLKTNTNLPIAAYHVSGEQGL
jgi:Delta-aminolevulinic acid dehydratase